MANYRRFINLNLEDAEVLYCENYLEHHPLYYKSVDECIRERTELPPKFDPKFPPKKVDGEGSWLIMPVRVFGKTHDQPRLTCYIGDEGLPYHYSGYDRYPIPWRKTINRIRDMLEVSIREIKPEHPRLTSVLCNKYRNGQEKIDAHSDSEKDLDIYAFIVSMSLGTERDFVLLHKKTKKRTVLKLKPGSVILMGPGTQENYKHSVPARAGVKDPRINLTFRSVKQR